MGDIRHDFIGRQLSSFTPDFPAVAKDDARISSSACLRLDLNLTRTRRGDLCDHDRAIDNLMAIKSSKR